MYTVNLTLDHGIFMPVTIMGAFTISETDYAIPGMLDGMVEAYRMQRGRGVKVIEVSVTKSK